MTYLDAFPTATWVGSKRDGKRWVGTTAPIVVLHTLEFNGWPDPDRWDSPAHLVANPNTGEIRQYIPMNKAAYAVRDNDVENDEPTWQVELWGNAANVPRYSDVWYEGVAAVCDLFVLEYGIPIVFEDFSHVEYGAYAPQRRTQDETRAFTGFLGHCHMGRGVDTHWDPGELDVARVLEFMVTNEEDDDVWIRDITDETWAQLYADGHITGEAAVMPDYYFADGPASDAERVHAFNKAMQSMSKMEGGTAPHTHPITLIGETGT